jgi:hypothetical protein
MAAAERLDRWLAELRDDSRLRLTRDARALAGRAFG